MALEWKWDRKVGEMEYLYKTVKGEWREGPKISLYEGNAFLIMIYLKEDGTYDLWGFMADEYHMKNILGLNKKQGYDKNLYNSDSIRITKFWLNKARYTKLNKLVSALVKAFDKIDIEIFTEE